MKKKKFKDPYDVRPAFPGERGRSPYWEWCHRNSPTDDEGRIVEPRGGNPSQFPEAVEPENSDEIKAILEVFDEGGLDKLTARQRRAFNLVVREGLSYSKAAKRMMVNESTVREHVLAAGKRLRKMCEDKV